VAILGGTGAARSAEPGIFALLTDGTTIEIRPARPDDFETVRDMIPRPSPRMPIRNPRPGPSVTPPATGRGSRHRRGLSPNWTGCARTRRVSWVDSFLAGEPRGGWLPRGQAVELLGCYGVPLWTA
jgi:hypothetical protein